MEDVVLGLGSNIDPENNLDGAATLLRRRWPGIRFSSVYRSKARDAEDQPDFLNAVALVRTEDVPENVQSFLQSIEKDLKKAPPFRFGPRTIDLDFLLYGDRVIDAPVLQVPHPRMQERRFVLEPLAELIGGNTRHPVLGKPWKALLESVRNQDCDKIEKIL